jgi:hypothetical protein
MASFRWRTRAAAVLLVLVWLGGCGPQNVADLRKKPHSVHSFEAPADCGTVYDRIARRARERYRFIPTAPHQPGVSAKLAPSGQSATITLWDGGRIGIRYILTADLRRRFIPGRLTSTPRSRRQGPTLNSGRMPLQN